jgi:carnitine O-acetyltransferase
MFLHGRTEVIRTLSEASRAFVLGMHDSERSDAERFNLLSQATTYHNALTRASSVGKGYDRHIMALKYLGSAGKGGVIKHPLFDDDMWALSQEWKLSTSGLSAGGRFLGTG